MHLAATLPSAALAFNHALLVLLLAVNCVFSATPYLLLALYLWFRRQGLAEEARMLALPLPPENELPHVLVQLPTFNEGALIGRIGAAVAELDWPRDRLHVQVLDDSRDGSLVHGERAVASLRRIGIDAVLIHRASRSGFKAGALAEGLARSEQEFVAMFDVDYLPPRDFLLRCMRPLLHDRRLCLVQARCDYLNARDNMLTLVQQRMLDAHFAIEQASRSWSGQVVPFNGTCGIWRRAAIEDAGGWHGDTLTEDLDLSYRAQLRGWRAVFLTTVTVQGELPRTFRSWRRQQFRWTKGFAEVAKKMLASVWRSRLSLRQKSMSSLHLGVGALGPIFMLIPIIGVIDLTIGDGLTWIVAGLACLLVVNGILGQALMILAGQRLARGAGLATEAARLPLVVGLQHVVGAANLWGALEAILGYGTSFVRTPKSPS